ncbi:MAG TPA: hypothetical protein DEP22_10085 [Porphyromonadaceae bacterium]|nr:hypothetical protein [Porphyromonadaceae bacterium]
MELEQLKQQWEILHKRLDEQEIINKQLMENAVKGKIKSISNENWGGLIFVIFTIPFIWIMQHNYKGLDTNVLYFGLFLMFFSLLFSIYSTFLFDKIMKKKSILEREKGLLYFKKINYISTFIAIVLGIVFMIWVTISMHKQLIQTHMLEIAILSFVAAMGFGIWVTYKYFRKINELHQNISDLKEFEKE